MFRGLTEGVEEILVGRPAFDNAPPCVWATMARVPIYSAISGDQMSKVFRRVLPALLLLAPVLFGSESLAAQESLSQALSPPSAPTATASTTASTQAASDDTADAERERSSAAVSPARRLVAAAAGQRTPEIEKVFGYNVPAFDEEAAAPDPDQTGSQQPAGQQPTGQQTGQQPTAQTGTANQPDPIQPLSPGQKMRRAFRGAFLSPTPYASSAFSATLTQLREKELPDKDFEDELGDWGSRFARTFATRTTRSIFINGVYASLFRQDPRYHRPAHKGFGARLAYAVSRVFVTRDDEGNTEPNYSRFAGSMTASALANVWERSTPGHDRIGTDATLRRFGRYFIFDALSNVVFREIIPTVFRR
jgi:hypothetical protein